MYERGWMKFNSPFPIWLASHNIYNPPPPPPPSSYAGFAYAYSIEIKFLWIRLRVSYYIQLLTSSVLKFSISNKIRKRRKKKELTLYCTTIRNMRLHQSVVVYMSRVWTLSNNTTMKLKKIIVNSLNYI